MSNIDEKARKRFEKKINNDIETGCHEWIARLNMGGYGNFRYKGKTWSAHRFSYIMYKGEIPKGNGFHGTCVLHKCDNRKCVNPDHLFLGTHQDNMVDRDEKGRQGGAKGKDNGMYDHTSYTFENKKKGWKLRCTQSYLRETFTLHSGNLSQMILGRLKTTGGWSLA